jgi:hypothetical protein
VQHRRVQERRDQLIVGHHGIPQDRFSEARP